MYKKNKGEDRGQISKVVHWNHNSVLVRFGQIPVGYQLLEEFIGL